MGSGGENLGGHKELMCFDNPGAVRKQRAEHLRKIVFGNPCGNSFRLRHSKEPVLNAKAGFPSHQTEIALSMANGFPPQAFTEVQLSSGSDQNGAESCNPSGRNAPEQR